MLGARKVDVFFGYPGGVTLPFYDALYDHQIKHILVRHEQNACFAAEGYARATGKVGVCCATSGPGATNLVTGLVDAMMDSIPVVAITGQVSTKLIGSDAFQEADTFGITRSCTKHNFLVKKLSELPQAIHEAFHIAATGRPGPVLVDIPKDVFQAQGHYTPVSTIHLPGYKLSTEGHAGQIRRAAQMIWEAERPMVYAGGGILAAAASAELRELGGIGGCAIGLHADGLGRDAERASELHQHAGHARQLRSQHGDDRDRSDHCAGRAFRRSRDRAAGGLRTACARDPRGYRSGGNREESRGRHPHRGRREKGSGEVEPDTARVGIRDEREECGRRKAWWSQIRAWRDEHPLEPEFSADEIKPQHLMSEIDRLSGGEAIVSSDVGQHQMWAAQFIRFHHPRLWINSGGPGRDGIRIARGDRRAVRTAR
jgi:acetolactate synthase-1/2/3 large subunit